MASFSFPQELAAAVREEYPSSIAVPFADLESELYAGHPNPMRVFSRMIDLFEISVTTAGLTAVASMIANRVPVAGNYARVLRELRENPKLSTGFWWELLRETLSAALEAREEGFAGELAGLYFSKKGKVSENAALLDSIPGLRNRAKGHSWTMPEEKYEELIHQFLPSLSGWLSMLSIFRRYTLISPQAVVPQDGHSLWDVFLLSGNRVKPLLRHLQCAENMRIGGVYLLKSDLLQGTGNCEQPPVAVSPLLLLRKTGGMVSELFIYQGGDSKKAVYSGSVSSEHVESAEEAQNAQTFLSSGNVENSGFSVRAERLLSPFRESVRELTSAYVKRMLELKIYHPETFVERKKITNQIEAFLSSGLPATLLVGASGLGKTSLMAEIASEWLETRTSERVIAVFPADTLPSSGRDLPEWIAAKLCPGKTLEEFSAQLEEILSKKEKFTALIIIEGLDRHSDPQSLLAGLMDMAETFKKSRIFRILGSTTPSVPDNYQRTGGDFSADLFYHASFGIKERSHSDPVGITLTALSTDELAEVYAAYQTRPETSPLTGFDELTEEMISALSHPLILRMAMEVYQGRALPRKIFGQDMLREYVGKRVFADPRRLDFVSELVDEMISRKTRSMPFEVLRKNPLLRSALVDDRASSPLSSLTEDQVLTLRPSVPGNLPFPPSFMMEFTFDRVLEYLIFFRIAGADTAAELTQKGPADYLAESRKFPSLRGALQLWGSTLAKQGAITPLLAFYELSDREAADAYLIDLIRDLADQLEGEEGENRLVTLLEVFGKRDADRTLDMVSKSAQELFIEGNWKAAHRALSTVAGIPGTHPLARVRERNRLVLLEKNMDLWTDALRNSDLCMQELGDQPPEAILARVLINRSSVVYDLGPRSDVPALLEKAARHSKEEVLSAAVANNRAIYHLYHDELETAEKGLKNGLLQLSDHTVQKAYLLNNLSLVLLSGSLIDPARLDEAELLANDALSIFRKAGHIQGISYATSNVGAIGLHRGKFDEAEASFEETRKIAKRIGEKWTAYGSLSNSGCALLMRPDADPEKAYRYAKDSMAAARSGDDRKGIGDAGLIAAKAAMMLKAAGKDIPPQEVIDLLNEARNAFQTLGQRLGEAMALYGLQEISSELPPIPEKILSGTDYAALKPGFRALPWQMFLLQEVF